MRIISSTIIATAGLALAGNVLADPITGAAAGYNVFIFGSGSFMSQNTDTMGNLAAGGDVSLMNYAVAQGIAGNSSTGTDPARLVVGGKLTAQNGGVGSNQDGAIYYGTIPPALTSFTANGGHFANQSLINFASSVSVYKGLSSTLGTLAQTGSTSFDASSDKLSLTGNLGGLNVFTVSLDTLNQSKEIDISSAAKSTVLINVIGNGTATFSNGTVVESGGAFGGASVLYNFVTATGVSLPGSKDPKGSILAPDANVTGGFGAMSGQLIAASYSGNTQFNDVEFNGSLPVPVPAALWLFGSGLLTLARWRRTAIA